jgi:hypothetical protein
MSPVVRIGPPEMGNTGREMFDNTRAAAYADADNDFAWAKFLSSLSFLLDPVADVTRPADGSERWTTLASPSRVPAQWLPVLAQWAGVRRPETMTDDELRDLIGPTAPGMWRGTRAGILAAVRRFLPEGAYLYWEEFADGDPYKFRVFTFNTDPATEALIRDALAHEKPAGLFPFEYEVRVGQTWRMHYDCGYTWWQTLDCFESWYDVLTQPPDECRDCPPTPEPPEPPTFPIRLDSISPASMTNNAFTTFTLTGEFPPEVAGRFARMWPTNPGWYPDDQHGDGGAYSNGGLTVVDATTATVSFNSWAARPQVVGNAKVWVVDADWVTPISNEIDLTITGEPPPPAWSVDAVDPATQARLTPGFTVTITGHFADPEAITSWEFFGPRSIVNSNIQVRSPTQISGFMMGQAGAAGEFYVAVRDSNNDRLAESNVPLFNLVDP